MYFRVFKKGSINLVRCTPEETVTRVYMDRWVKLEADCMNVEDSKHSTLKECLTFFAGKTPVGMFKSSEWDFVVPEDSEVIYNDHG